MSGPGANRRTTARVDRDGVRVPREITSHVDVLLDGRRVWSFRPDVDGVRSRGAVVVAWPHNLTRHLHGRAEVRLREGGGEPFHVEEVDFGGVGAGEDGRVAVADEHGRSLVVDDKGRLVVPFDAGDGDGSGGDDKAALLAAARVVIDVLEDAGVEPFLVYGTLLGAVREGDFIGHDNDVDIGYLSRRGEPVDVVRESLQLERRMREAGLAIDHRYSGGGFKVMVVDATGIARGLDVFAGFMHHDHFGLLGEILTPFQREWLVPRVSIDLAGHAFPAPAEPERLLTATYGPGWRQPDPTFAFDHDDPAHRRLGGWFRGLREQRNQWERFYSRSWENDPLRRPHELARILHRRRPEAFVVDVGCGRGTDLVWLAEQGHAGWGFDFTPRPFHYLAQEAAARELPLHFHPTNLLSLRHTMTWGARLARVEGERTILARHVLDCVPKRGRLGLLQLGRMGLRGGGAMFCEFFLDDGRREVESGDLIWGVDPDELGEEIAAAGGQVRWHRDYDPKGPHELPTGSADWPRRPRGRRMVVSW